jgi:probable phosphoglycerate mutase
MELLLIRHGVTNWNQEHRFQGQIDIPLNELGREQAALTAGHLQTLAQSAPTTAVYTSDLQRAWHTAALIAQALKLKLRIDARLRERHYGAFEGKTLAELEATGHGEDYRRWRNREPDFALPGGGESLRDFFARSREVLEDIVTKHPPGERIVVVTHGGVLDCVYRIACDMDMSALRQHPLHNAALNRVAWDGSRFSLIDWGSIEHLQHN